MNKKITKIGELAWIVGTILCAIGNCFVDKSQFGLSAIIAPAFILQEKLNFLTVGFCEYIIQGILLALCCLIIGKFKWIFIATVCNILFYGACFDFVSLVFAGIQPSTIPVRILIAVIGMIITGFAVALMLRTYIPPSIYEVFVKEVAVAKGFNLNRMKLLFDASMLVISFLLMFVLLGEFRFDIIGIITVVAAFLNSVIIGFFGNIFDKHCVFSPAIPKLYKILHPNSNK